MSRYSGFPRRLIASIIDFFIILIFVAFIQFVSGMKEEGILGGYFFYLLVLLLGWAYFALQESSSRQATVGKQAMNIIVTDLEGKRLSLARASLRYAAKIIAAIPVFIGFLLILFTEKKQGLHDILAKTLVLIRED